MMSLHHVGLTVPDARAAARFLVEVLGCEQLFETGPGSPANADRARQIRVPEGTILRNLIMLRSGHGHIELFEYERNGQSHVFPDNSDYGGHHLAFVTDDIDAAAARLEAQGVELMAPAATAVSAGFNGMRWMYFLSPWGTQMELVQESSGGLISIIRD